MQALLQVIMPVFLVVGYGYLSRVRGWISDDAVAMLMKFAQNFAVPLLLFSGIAQIDLGETFHLPLLLSFYIGAFSGGAFAFCGARYLFKRSLTDSVAIGFVGLFSNCMLLGIPITERAYGIDALGWNFAIISIHAPLLYAVGITAMELARNHGQNISAIKLAKQVSSSILKNPLIIGISAGWVVNVTGLSLPLPVWDSINLMKSAAIPVALFGLGGVLVRYRPEGDMRIIAWTVTASLLVHPLITYGLGHFVFHLEVGPLRSAALTGAMATGVNGYLFADMYGSAKRVAASSVLIGTGLSVLTLWCWLAILP
ncbi:MULTISPECIES: AEC family transporter [Pacificibacter]|uniref:AEC family transporter n=1 Tax=Pacificibacter TaxID=1042323 RepID=UPI001C093644|nr:MULTISPECIES: AEC family transporter [Pacificibacter]MBU2935230.1 AEC family transporter [Pacificibacter marinus]MDO6615384.1 AEC family transporter [Pacificibacter sp. 1_MG-2023]